MQAPTGEWKSVVGWSFVAASFGVWIFLLLKLYGKSLITLYLFLLIIFPLRKKKKNFVFALINSEYFNYSIFYFLFSVYPPLPASFDLEHQQAQLERMIKLDMNPVAGPARQYREQ